MSNYFDENKIEYTPQDTCEEIGLIRVLEGDYNFLTKNSVYTTKGNILVVENISYTNVRSVKFNYCIKTVKVFNDSIYVMTEFKNKSYLFIVDFLKIKFLCCVKLSCIDFCVSLDGNLLILISDSEIVTLVEKSVFKFNTQKTFKFKMLKKDLTASLFLRNKNELFICWNRNYYSIYIPSGFVRECTFGTYTLYQEYQTGMISILSDGMIQTYTEDSQSLVFFGIPKECLICNISNDSSVIFFITKNNLCFGLKKDRKFEMINGEKYDENDENENENDQTIFKNYSLNQDGKWFISKTKEKTFIYQVKEKQKITNSLVQILLKPQENSSLNSLFTDICDTINLLKLVKEYL